MTAATAPRTLAVESAKPHNDMQRRASIAGIRGFWVEASGKTIVNGMRITKYLVTVLLDGYIKCPCQAGKHSGRCCHISAVRAHIGSPRLSNAIADAPVATKVTKAAGPQMTFACARPRHETAILALDDRPFSIYKS